MGARAASARTARVAGDLQGFDARPAWLQLRLAQLDGTKKMVSNAPETISGKLEMVSNAPEMVSNQLKITSNAPATPSDNPATTADNPATTADNPGATADNPGATADAPATTADAPATTAGAPAPITAPQVPAPAAPPRALPVESPPSQPNTQIENPNLVLPPPSLATTPQTPAATTPTTATGAPINPIAPAVPDVVSAPSTDVASGTERPSDDYSIDVAPGTGNLVYDGRRGLVLAQGKVTFQYRDLIVTGERGVIDNNLNRATLAGNLQVEVRGQTFQGQSLSFDLASGRWLLSSVAKTFPPELFPPGTVLSPLYVRNGTVKGQGDDALGEKFRFTSCDRDDYYLESNRIEFYRDKNGQPQRLVLRKNSLYVLGQKILPLPVYVIALVAGAGSRRSPIQATFGQNDTDGYFVKSFYDLRATERRTQSLLVDLLSKRGLGLGLQQLNAAGGLLYFYALSSQTGGRETDFRALQRNSLGNGIILNTRLEGTSNNSLTGEGVAAQNGSFTFGRNGNNAQTNAIFNFNRSDSLTGQNRTGSITVDHQQNFGRGFSLQTSANVNRSTNTFNTLGVSSTTNDAATGDLNVTLGKTAKPFDLYLLAELHPDLVNHRVNQLERLPQLTLQSSSDRIQLPVLSKYLAGNFTLGLASFNEPRAVTTANGQTQLTGLKKDRADLFYNFNDKAYRLLGKGRSQSNFRAGGNFEQAFYSDDYARYNYSYNFNLVNTLGNLTLQANYFNARTFGATPFQFDFFTPSENLDYTASYGLGQKLRLNLSGGQDIYNSYDRDLIFTAQFAPSAKFYGSLGTSYGLENSNFGEIYGNFNVARNRRKFGGGELAFGFRYNPNGAGLTRANASADVNLGAKTRVQGLTSYNGFSKKFEFTQIRVIQDLHCFNLYLNYDNQRNQIRVDLALKAFPFADTRFGRNIASEGFDSSVGSVR